MRPSVDEVDETVNLGDTPDMEILEHAPDTVTPTRVSRLTGPQREMALRFQPALKLAADQFNPIELLRIVAAAVGEQFAAQPKPQARLATAMVRGMAVREEMKEAEGGSLSAEETGRRLGITKAAVLKRYQKGQLLGWREARQNAVRFPVWQFTEANLLPGLSEILPVFQDADWLDEWGRIVFFLSPLGSLQGQRPLDLLRAGDQRRVLLAAQALKE